MTKSDVKTPRVDVVAVLILGGVPVPIPIGTTDACTRGVTCPVYAGDLDVYKGVVNVPVEDPLVSKKSLCCINELSNFIFSISDKCNHYRLFHFL